MSTPIEMSSLLALLERGMLETFESVQGIYLDKGTSLFETLAEISAGQASQPMGNCATMAAHVAHTHYYIEILEQYLLHGEAEDVNWNTIWETISMVTDDEWSTMITDLRSTYDRIKSHLANEALFDDAEKLGEMLGIIIHTAYHLGEIRQMMCHLQR